MSDDRSLADLGRRAAEPEKAVEGKLRSLEESNEALREEVTALRSLLERAAIPGAPLGPQPDHHEHGGAAEIPS